MCHNLLFPADLITFTEEILNGRLQFLCSGGKYHRILESTEKKRHLKNCSNLKILVNFKIHQLVN